MTKVKICCISSHVEAKMAIDYGAAAIGLVGNMPSGPGVIKDDLIKEIANAIDSEIFTFLLTSKTSVNEIVSHHSKVMTNSIQIVDALAEGTYDGLRAKLSDINLVQVIHVLDEGSVEEAIRLSEEVDYILLDSGNPNLVIKELGGTGRVHNWKLSRKIVEQSKVPVYLAGGLNASNVKRALDEVQPYGIDLCSGVRTEGELDERKLNSFFKEVYR